MFNLYFNRILSNSTYNIHRQDKNLRIHTDSLLMQIN